MQIVFLVRFALVVFNEILYMKLEKIMKLTQLDIELNAKISNAILTKQFE